MMRNNFKASLFQYIMNTYFLSLRAVPQQIPRDEYFVDEDIHSLLARMSTEEKLTLIAGVDGFCIPPLANHNLPPVWTSDATRGVRGVDAPVTAFPSPIAMAASFDPQLIFNVGQAIAKECRSVGVSILLGPGVNIARVPINGRNFEYLGEDPYLAGAMAVEYVKGVQSKGVAVTVKHFACNNSEYDRHKTNSIVDEKTLREIYLPPFKACIDGGAVGVMTSYNQVNGEYASENSFLIDEILRKEWKFPYMVISDWNSLYSKEGAFTHGVDLEMPKRTYFPPVDSILTESEEKSLDAKVLHILNTLMALGVYKRDLIEGLLPLHVSKSEEIALQLAKDSLVLLKNDNHFLPLKKLISTKIAVIGPYINGEPTGGGGSSFIKQAFPGKSISHTLKEECSHLQVQSFSGKWYKNPEYRDYIRSCDAVIVSVGFSHVDESEAYDRRWSLHPHDIKDIEQACKLNDHTVVVTHSGGAIEMSTWVKLPKAIIFGWYQGSFFSQAIKALLFGEYSPSGRLPITIAHTLDDYLSMKNYPKDFSAISYKRIQVGQGNPKKRSVWPITYDEKLMVGYRQFDTVGPEPLFPFGFGLSYSEFTLENLSVVSKEKSIEVSCFIFNSGDIDSSQVIQLYMRPEQYSENRPFQQLRKFEKVFLHSKERKEVSFTLGREDVTYFDEKKRAYCVDSGNYTICIGFSSREILLKSELLKMP